MADKRMALSLRPAAVDYLAAKGCAAGLFAVEMGSVSFHFSFALC